MVSDFIKDVTEQIKTRVSNSILVCYLFTWFFVNRHVFLYWFFSEDSFNSKLEEISKYRFDWVTDVLYPLLGVLFYLFIVPMVTVSIQFFKSKFDDRVVNQFEDFQYRKATLRERKRQRSEQIFKRVIENEVNNRELRKAAAVENKIRLLNEKANAAVESRRRLDDEISAQKTLEAQYSLTAEKYKEAKSAEHLESVIIAIMDTIADLKSSLVVDQITADIKYVTVKAKSLDEVFQEGMKVVTLSINTSTTLGFNGLGDRAFDIDLRLCDKLQLDNLSAVFKGIQLDFPLRLSVEKFNDFMSFNYNSLELNTFRKNLDHNVTSIIFKIVEVKEPFLSYIPVKRLLDDVFKQMDIAKGKLVDIELKLP